MRYAVSDGEKARIVTSRASAIVSVEVSDIMQPGHVSLPNGMGLDEPANGATTRVGVAPNDLTDGSRRDPVAGTPWHKFVPARIEALAV